MENLADGWKYPLLNYSSSSEAEQTLLLLKVSVKKQLLMKLNLNQVSLKLCLGVESFGGSNSGQRFLFFI